MLRLHDRVDDPEVRTSPDAQAVNDGLSLLGMNIRVAGAVRRALRRRAGLVLVAGQRGSGRRRTLSQLRALALGEATATPVEDAQAMIAAVSNMEEVIAVDRLHSPETAQFAARMADEGSLVIAGIEEPDAIAAVVALAGLGVDRFLIASILRLALGQRLVDALCPACREPVQADRSTSALLGFDPGSMVYRPLGCEQCGESGFVGRTAIFEGVEIDDGLRRLISGGGDASILARHAFLAAPNLGSAARAAVREGITTPQEAVRISRMTITSPLALGARLG